LVWAVVAGLSRQLVQRMMRDLDVYRLGADSLPMGTRLVKWVFVDYGFAIDIAGLVWLALSLTLLILASRQKFGIAWVWLCALCQGLVTALGAVAVGWGVYAPHDMMLTSGIPEGAGLLQKLSSVSLPVLVTIAIVAWMTVLVYLLVERARFNRHQHGPTLTDGLRTQTYH
jgi:hypothetical protein